MRGVELVFGELQDSASDTPVLSSRAPESARKNGDSKARYSSYEQRNWLNVADYKVPESDARGNRPAKKTNPWDGVIVITIVIIGMVLIIKDATKKRY
jgi:hypothetical protein